MDIYFLRHANAGVAKLNPESDEKRPLDKQGIQQSHTVGRGLAALEVELDEIIASPLLRAFQTAEIAAKELGHQRDIVIDGALRPEASFAQFQALLRKYAKSKAIMVVGHNPNLSEFLNQLLAGNGESRGIDLKKGAIAKVEKEGRSPAELKWLMPPKVVRALQTASASSSRPKTVRK